MQALLVQRKEITEFITNVGATCRKKSEPPPPAPKDAATLSKLAEKLKVYASRLVVDPGIAFTKEYYDDIDPVFMQAGTSKGWEIYDPITRTTMIWKAHPCKKTTWWVQYDPSSEYGPFVYHGASCRSQFGCSARVVTIKPSVIIARVAQLSAEAAAAQQYNDGLPKLKVETLQAFLRSANGAEIQCKSFGIPQMFANTGASVPVDPNGLMFNYGVPTLSAAEGQIVAKALKTNILPKLEAIDALISEQLNSGIELGCFNTIHNGCDWSPNRLIDFTHNYRKEVDAAREADVQRCSMYTTHGQNLRDPLVSGT